MEPQQTLGGRYKLLDELGTGGMAVVWKGHDEVLGRSVAVKVLAARFAGDQQSRDRIRGEARTAATLSHPNIAQIYDFGESEQGGACLPYVVMELIKGPTLAEKVKQGPIPPRSVFRICGEVAAALAAAHAHGLVHRDIKPANVMVAPSGTKVVDFGIAAAAGPGRPDDEVLGTPAYLAPERLLSDAIEPASDMYALGVLLYRLLTHESPWTVESTTQMLDAHVYIDPKPMPQLAGVPPEITRLVDACLRKEPGERPTAAEAATTLGDAAEAVVPPARAGAEVVVPQARAAAEGVEAVMPQSGSAEAGAVGAGAAGAGVPQSGAVAAGTVVPRARAAAAALGAPPARVGTPVVGAVVPQARAATPAAGSGAVVPRARAATPAGEPAVPRARAAAPGAAAPGAVAPGAAGSGAAGSGAAGSGAVGSGALAPGAAGFRASRAAASPATRKKRRLAVAGSGVVAALVAAGLLAWAPEPTLDDGRAADVAIPPVPVPATSTAVVAAPGTRPTSASPAGAGRRATTRAGASRAPTAGAPAPADPTTTRAPAPGEATGTTTPTATVPTGGAAPTGVPAPTTEPPATTDPPSGGRTLTSAGGSVVARCTGGRVTLTSPTPAEGWKADRVDAGPSLTATAVFRQRSDRVRMTVTCVAGTPTAVVLPL